MIDEDHSLFGIEQLAEFDNHKNISADNLEDIEREEYDKLVKYRNSIERFLYTTLKDHVIETGFKKNHQTILLLGEKHHFKQEVIDYYKNTNKLLRTIGYNINHPNVEFAQSAVRFGRKRETYTAYGTALSLITTAGVYDYISHTFAWFPASILFLFMTGWTGCYIITDMWQKGYCLDKHTLRQNLDEYISLRCKIGRDERKKELKKTENNTIYAITLKIGDTLVEKIIEKRKNGAIFKEEEYDAVMQMRAMNFVFNNAKRKLDELLSLDRQIYEKERKRKNAR